MSHSRPCHQSRFGFCGVRSTFVASASSQTTSAAKFGSGPGPAAGLNGSAPGRKSTPRLSPSLASRRSWISGSGSARPIVASSSSRTSSGTGNPSARASCPDDDLGDQRLRPLARPAELEHVEPVVVGLDEGGQRPALPQGRHVPRRRDIAHRARAYRHTPVALDRFCRDAALRRSRPGTRHLYSRAGPRPRRGMKPLDQGAAIPPMGHNMRRVRSAYRTRP